MEKISEQQKIKREKEIEMQRKKEEEKKAKEEEKRQKDKEWREQMDKDRAIRTNKSWRELAREDVDSYIKNNRTYIFLPKKSKIYLDLTTTIGHYFIQVDENDDIIINDFTNCLCNANDYVNQRNECKIATTSISGINQKFTKLVYPINNGKIDDYDILSLFLDYILRGRICFCPEDEISILFAEPINCLNEDRETLVQIFFEDYFLNRVFLIKPSILTLLSEGKSTGIVVELGEGTTNFIPIFDKCWIRHATTSINMGKKDLIEDKDYEIIFRPEIISQISNYLLNSINKCDKELKNEFLNNIVLTGVDPKHYGLKEKFREEICSKLNSSESEVNITINEKGVKKGLETLFSDPVFDQMWITKEEYEEKGAWIVVHKSF